MNKQLAYLACRSQHSTTTTGRPAADCWWGQWQFPGYRPTITLYFLLLGTDRTWPVANSSNFHEILKQFQRHGGGEEKLQFGQSINNSEYVPVLSSLFAAAASLSVHYRPDIISSYEIMELFLFLPPTCFVGHDKSNVHTDRDAGWCML